MSLDYLFVGAAGAVGQTAAVVGVAEKSRPRRVVWITLLGIDRTIRTGNYSAATPRLNDVVSPRIGNTIVNELLLRHGRTRYVVDVE